MGWRKPGAEAALGSALLSQKPGIPWSFGVSEIPGKSLCAPQHSLAQWIPGIVHPLGARFLKLLGSLGNGVPFPKNPSEPDFPVSFSLLRKFCPHSLGARGAVKDPPGSPGILPLLRDFSQSSLNSVWMGSLSLDFPAARWDTVPFSWEVASPWGARNSEAAPGEWQGRA